MPPHASHLLQRLDVSCFAPLKRAYGQQVDNFIRNHIFHITKVEFLPAFKAAYQQSITEGNIHAGFRGAGLVPFNPEAVLSKLDVKLRTPTPPAEAAPWEPGTPSNVAELGCQTALLRDRIQNHQHSSPSSTLEQLSQLSKGAEQMAHQITLMRSRIVTLQNANKAATERRKRKKKYIQKEGVLTVAEVMDLIA